MAVYQAWAGWHPGVASESRTTNETVETQADSSLRYALWERTGAETVKVIGFPGTTCRSESLHCHPACSYKRTCLHNEDLRRQTQQISQA